MNRKEESPIPRRETANPWRLALALSISLALIFSEVGWMTDGTALSLWRTGHDGRRLTSLRSLCSLAWSPQFTGFTRTIPPPPHTKFLVHDILPYIHPYVHSLAADRWTKLNLGWTWAKLSLYRCTGTTSCWPGTSAGPRQAGGQASSLKESPADRWRVPTEPGRVTGEVSVTGRRLLDLSSIYSVLDTAGVILLESCRLSETR